MLTPFSTAERRIKQSGRDCLTNYHQTVFKEWCALLPIQVGGTKRKTSTRMSMDHSDLQPLREQKREFPSQACRQASKNLGYDANDFPEIFELRDNPKIGAAILTKIVAENWDLKAETDKPIAVDKIKHSELLFTIVHFIFNNPLHDAE